MKAFLPFRFLLITCLLAVGHGIYAQGNSQCGNASPFCTGNVMNFPAGVNAGQAQPGPSYGCLFSQPNPAWFYFQMQTSGPVSIAMSANSDIDFIAWGPFTCLSGVCNSLTAANQVPGSGYANPTSNGCSYSGAPTETLTIASAVPGAYYVMLITNFSNQQQNITFNQTNGNAPGAGVTNCNILCSLTATNSGVICPNGSATISATTGTSVVSYTWTGPGGYSSNNLTNVVSPPVSGVYTITAATANGTCGAVTSSTCRATTMVTVVPLPSYTVTPMTTTVCQNGSYVVSAASANPQIYSYQWSGPIGMSFTSPNGAGSVVNTAPIGTQTALLVYTVVVTPTVLNCPLATTMSVRINNPPTPTLTAPAPFCNTSTQTVMTANPGGGTWWGNPIVNSLGIVSPNQANAFGTFSVGYTYTIGNCTTSNIINISVSQYNTAALTATIPNKCVNDPPLNLLSIVSNTMGVWSGVNVSANTFTPAGLITNTYVLTYFNPSTPYANVCPASSTAQVVVFNPPIPSLGIPTLVCSNGSPVNLQGVPAGGVWSSNAGVTPGGLLTPSQSPNIPGVNSVVYTAGQGTCVASSTGTYMVAKFNPATLTTNSLQLCNTTNTLDLMTLATNPVPPGTWINGLNPNLPIPGLNSANGTFNPNAAAQGFGITNVMLQYTTTSTPSHTMCEDRSNLAISILYPANPQISVVGPVCNADAPFQLQVTPNTGSFVTSLYLTSTGLFTPSLTAVGANTVQYVIGTSTCNVRDTKIVNVEAFVPSTIIGTIPDQCNTNGVVNLLPLTANNLGTWSGPGVLGTSFNPGVSGIGNLGLIYKTASSPSGLCPSQSILSVAVYSLANPAITQAGPYCNNAAPFRLMVSPLGGVFGSSNASAVDANGWFNPPLAQIGINIVNYSVTSGPCVAYTSANVQIERFIPADFLSYAGPFCRNEPGLDLNSIAQYPGGMWSGPGVSGSIFTPANANIGNSNIIRYYTHSITEELCPDTSDMRIQVNDIPKVGIVRDIEKGCNPVVVNFNTPNTNGGKGEWTLGDGSEPEKGLSTTHTFTAPGTYSVVFNYWDELGCKTQTVMQNAVQVFPVPEAGFIHEPDEVTIANPQVQFVNRTKDIGSSTYNWQIANMYSSNEVNPTASFYEAGEYRITLTATNIYDCQDVVSDILIVKPDFSVFIPNTFTPNADELNDFFMPVFSPYGLDSRTYEMEIFDRWGHLLFNTKDYTKGWDGTVNNKGTEPLKQEVYVYKIKFKDLEGRVYNRLGHVTLLR